MAENHDRWSVSLSGVTLLGRYAVERKMGGGGMATVYLAKDEHLGLPVVVKVPHPAFLADPSFRTRFEQETEGLIALQHPHIVRILARGEHEGLPFLVMQYLPGGSLGDRLRATDGGTIAFDDVQSWLQGVTEALDYIHARGIVHRDIKPDNVLFDEHGYVYLSDFGIAKAIGADDTGLTATGATPGSPAYMAPEQARTSNLEGSSDQYSLAASLYEALSGTPAYDGKTLVDVLLKKQSEDPRHLSEIAPDVPVAAANAIMRALARDPEYRFPTCRAFLDAVVGKPGTTTMAVPSVEAPPAEEMPAPAEPASPVAPEPAPSRPQRSVGLTLSVGTKTVILVAILIVGAWLFADAIRPGDTDSDDEPAPPFAGTWVLDKAAMKMRMAHKPPGRAPSMRRRMQDELLKLGMRLVIRNDGSFAITAPFRMRSTEAGGTWDVRKGQILFRIEGDRDGKRAEGMESEFRGRYEDDRIRLMRRGFEIPMRRE